MFPTGLSMLWESTDPERALQQRFGLDSFDDAAGWITKVLAQEWALDVEACDRILISAGNAIAWLRTDRGMLVAKWSRAEDQFRRLAAIADLLGALHEQGLPVAPPLASVDTQRRILVDSGPSQLSMMVQPLVDGDLLDTTDEDAVRQAGACLASLHGALAVDRNSRLIDPGPPVDLRRRIETWFDHDDATTAPSPALARLRERLESLPPVDRAPQLIHNDYRASNILTSGSEIRAIIDFDGVTRDHCVTDLAHASVLLGTHFTDWQPTPLSVRRTFLSGYRSVRSLSHLERGWLDVLTLWYGIRMIPAGDDAAGWAAAVDDAG